MITKASTLSTAAGTHPTAESTPLLPAGLNITPAKLDWKAKSVDWALGEDIPVEQKVKAILYGIGSCGKSPTSTRLPIEWGTGILIAADKTSARMKSVLPEDMKRLLRITPNGYERRRGDDPKYNGAEPDEIVGIDWKDEAYDLAQRDWKQWLMRQPDPRLHEFAEKLGFIIWDGLDGTGENMLAENAKKNYFSEKGPSSGPSNPQLDIGKKVKLPQQGDYLMVGSEMCEIVRWLVDQPYHVIVTTQEAIQEQESAKHRELLFGPMHVGRAGPRQLPKYFDVTLYLNKEKTKENPSGYIRVQLAPDASRVCGFKTSQVQKALDAPYKILTPDPASTRAFWTWIDQVGRGAA